MALGQTASRAIYGFRRLVRRAAGVGRPSHVPGWLLAVLTVVTGVVLLPIIAITVLSLTSSGGTWAHLVKTVLPQATMDTLVLMSGVATLTLLTGTSTAWLVTMYRFPGRQVLDRLLILPLAVPTYIMAYCYVELLDSTGPIQTALRYLTGWKLARDYWFPDVRSMTGAIFILSAALYPYVYLSARAAFLQQSVCALEVARTLGRTEWGALWSVALPLARPALLAGTSLALMECLNDIGAVEYLGVQTLTASVYSTWLERQSLAGAAQIASLMLIFVFVLYVGERWSRGLAKYYQTTGRYRPITFANLNGWRGSLATLVCLLPVVFGIAVPGYVLLNNAMAVGVAGMDDRFWHALGYSLEVASAVAIVTVLLGLVLAYGQRIVRGVAVNRIVGLAGLGYAIPGTILAVGLLIPLAAADNWLREFVGSWMGLTFRQFLAGTTLTVVLALTIRFMAISLGTFDAALQRISPNLDTAARTLGETAATAFFRVHLPLLMPAIGAGALIVFVDAMKELPATLLLQPFNSETLATYVYGKADAYEFEAAAVAALAIVAVGLIPILLLHRALAVGRHEH